MRRRYFVIDGRDLEIAERVVAILREAGITAWTSVEYSRAFSALVTVKFPYLFTDFDVVCIEREDERGIIDSIISKIEQYASELSAPCSAADDAYIDALCRLAQVPGVQLLLDNSWMPQPMQRQRRVALSRLLGIDALSKFSGWIEKRTGRNVYVQLYLPAAACNTCGFYAAFPISSCPALQQSEVAVSTEARSVTVSEEDVQLRPYQAEQKANILKAWQTARRVMLQMPTGTGKTRLFVSLIHDIQQSQPDAHVLIVAHRTELIEQISQSLTLHYGLLHSILGDKNAHGDASILVASIQMLSRRIGKGAAAEEQRSNPKQEGKTKLRSFDYIIIDEAHHSLAPTYKKLLEAYADAKVLGVTATPYRLKKAAFTEIYDTLVESASMRQFITKGYLASYRLYTISDRTAAMNKVNRLTKFGVDGDYKAQDLSGILDTETETERLYDCYEQFAAGRKGIVYAVSRDHAAHIAALFNKKGVCAAAIDCDTPREERCRLICDFKCADGSLQVLVNVELFTEGFDCPSIDFVLLARPTRSLTLYLQQVGRALRPSPNGGEVLLLDCAGLYNRFGLPERSRDWQLHFKCEKPRREDYTKRPLGSSFVSGLMKEVERQQKEIVYSDGATSVYTFDGTKYGLCDKAGRVIVRAEYDKLTPTAYGWFIGEQAGAGETRYDVLTPDSAKVYSFQYIAEETTGVYTAHRIVDGKTYACRFDQHLRLIPSKTIKLSDGAKVYQHGVTPSQETPQRVSLKALQETSEKQRTEVALSFYTTSLALDAPIYNRCIAMKNGATRLKGINCEDCIIAGGQMSNFLCTETVGGHSYTVTTSDLWIASDGTLYRPVRVGFPLHYTATADGITLYDAHFAPLLRGDSLELFNDHCIIHRFLQPPLTINYLDYLLHGLTPVPYILIEHGEVKTRVAGKQRSVRRERADARITC